ncbi:helix-turn-helix transcriptional regulator (plasmid) [Tistrella bauzanensis]|uniref:Helix-turn-helix transcriptional regulator n=1 Tax=Tistrella arctica TaxID=3133430 RepID=A0ABU9YNL8_9PROT
MLGHTGHPAREVTAPVPSPPPHDVDVFGHWAARSLAEKLQRIDRPVVAMAAEFAEGNIGTHHDHPRGQIEYALTGVMTAITDDGTWVVPPRTALWIPARTMHQVRNWGPLSLRTLYLDMAVCAALPTGCRVFRVSDLLHALIVEMVAVPHEYPLDGREARIADLLIGELGRMPDVDLHAPMPQDRRLARICREVLKDPAAEHDLDHWAGIGGMARRTLTRQFRRETGLTFNEWRQQVRLLEALPRLAAGETVTNVALDLGYESPSAFTAMFRRTLGATPRDYLRTTTDGGAQARGGPG